MQNKPQTESRAAVQLPQLSVHRSLKVSAGAALEPWKLFQERAGDSGTGGGGDAERKGEGEKYT